MVDFHVYADTEELSQAAARLFADLSHKAHDLRGRFIVALSGGSTPRRLFEILATPQFAEMIQWDSVVVFWGDDRAVGPDHEWSNYKLAHESLLAHVPIPKEYIVRIRGELGAAKAAEVMLEELRHVFGDESLPRFDLIIQGMGGDGHTASLFPGTDDLNATDWVVPVFDPPADPKVDRVTLSFPVLNQARVALFLAAGADKRDKISEIMNDPSASERYPAARLEAEKTFWYVDEAAFAGLSGVEKNPSNTA
ncbi:6-phosphogluconolactonase [Pseudodesulfovibrio piezophilus]|uniref:6-phosphogluconolactonase n=1 Tax=Pseudodesulfovibrio piezophilus (strain DSM 21447 / JCM 15486 / C1TLV30) TaxID=1322246 RepID=M1WK51_PSEP2|nr:6-phosphogluconolactonase [Pseudodesulfovibrio piezophilus]CCH48991.1 6-phosphogluconolactonase [Pseudodesulfovibrio piezophilus C1TLV30]